MKKLMIGLVVAGLIGGLGTAAYAATTQSTGTGTTNTIPSLEQMLPHMKQEHPNITDQQLKAMYNSMQSMMNGSEGNMMSGQNESGGMMGNSTQTPQVSNGK